MCVWVCGGGGGGGKGRGMQVCMCGKVSQAQTLVYESCNGYKLRPPISAHQAPPTNHTHLDGLNDLPEWQLGGQCVAMVDDGLAAPCHIESWGRERGEGKEGGLRRRKEGRGGGRGGGGRGGGGGREEEEEEGGKRRRRKEGRGGGGRREEEEGEEGGGRGGIHSLSSQQSISMQRHPCSNARMYASLEELPLS